MGNLSEAMEKLHEFALSKGTLKAMPTQEEIAEKKRLEHDAIIKSWQAQERTKYFKASLWGDEAERSFTFQDWQPAMQGENEQTARNVANQAYTVMKELDGRFIQRHALRQSRDGENVLSVSNCKWVV